LPKCETQKQEKRKMDTFLREKDLAALLAVSVATLRAWRLRGKGPRYVKIGSAVRYRQEDINAWLDSRPSGGGDNAGH
jgi:predicted DNA-binding transcriptional regulator AlpA